DIARHIHRASYSGLTDRFTVTSLLANYSKRWTFARASVVGEFRLPFSAPLGWSCSWLGKVLCSGQLRCQCNRVRHEGVLSTSMTELGIDFSTYIVWPVMPEDSFDGIVRIGWLTRTGSHSTICCSQTVFKPS